MGFHCVGSSQGLPRTSIVLSDCYPNATLEALNWVAVGWLFPLQWVRRENYIGSGKQSDVGFSIKSKGYAGIGWNGAIYVKDFWEYEPIDDLWTQKVDFGGTARWGAVGFSIGSKGYIGTGSDSTGFTKDFWEYDPVADTWTTRADCGGIERKNAIGFSIYLRGYIGCGNSLSGLQVDFWEYPVVHCYEKV
jgi:hypothetical protein